MHVREQASTAVAARTGTLHELHLAGKTRNLHVVAFDFHRHTGPGQRDPLHLQVADALGKVRTQPGLAVGDPRIEPEERPQAQQRRRRRPRLG